MAIVLAYLVGMIVAFALMRHHVFDAKAGDLRAQVAKFVVVNVIAVLQTLAISLVLVHWVFPAFGIQNHAEAIAHLVGVLVPAVTSYFGHRMLTFK